MLDKYKLNYVIRGDGEAVVFLHGWGGNINSFAGVMKKIVGIKGINLDFSGFGQSQVVDGADVYDYAESVYLLLHRLNIKKCSLVAHSFGGRVAIILATMYNIEISKLVLVGSAGLKPRANMVKWLKIKIYKLKKWLVKKRVLKEDSLSKLGSSDYKVLSPQMKKSFIKIVNQELDFLVKKINAPTLLVWGKKDKSSPYYMAKKFNKNIKNSGLITYAKAGHFCYFEEFYNFCKALDYFLRLEI